MCFTVKTTQAILPTFLICNIVQRLGARPKKPYTRSCKPKRLGWRPPLRAANPFLCRGIVPSFIKRCERAPGTDTVAVCPSPWGKGPTTAGEHFAEQPLAPDRFQRQVKRSVRHQGHGGN